MRAPREPAAGVAAYDDAVSAAPGPAAPVPLRAARGVVVAAVGLLLAVAGHVVGGGDTAPGALGIPVAGLVVAACILASSRSWTPARLLTALAGVQVLVHGSLLLGAPSGTVDPRLASVAATHAGHAHDHAAALTPGMLVAHVVAVVLAALVLARVDVAVVVLWHLARRLLLPALPTALPLPGAPTAPVDSLLRPAHAVLLAAAASRRGPPLGLRCA